MKNRLNALQKELKRTSPAKRHRDTRPYMFNKSEIIVSFKNGVNQAAVSDYSLQVIKDLLKAANLTKATISDSTRTPEDQAAIMYRNLENEGVEAQLRLYGASGDKVIQEYVRLKAEGKSKSEIIAGMLAKINALGPTNVSRHTADPSQVNIIDIAPSSIEDKPAFEKAIKTESRISRYFLPPDDPAYHIEIPQNQAVAQSLRLTRQSRSEQFYDDLSAIQLQFNSESIEITHEQSAESATKEFFSPSEEAEAQGSFELVNNDYVYKDDSPNTASPRRATIGTDKFSDLKPAEPSDQVDREMNRIDQKLDNPSGGNGSAVLAKDIPDFDRLEEEVPDKPDSKTKEEIDFAKDLKAILSGEKLYDPETKNLVDHKREVHLDDEVPEAPSAPTKAEATPPKEQAPAQVTNEPYDLFEQIEKNRSTEKGASIAIEDDYLAFEDLEMPPVSAQSKNTIVNIEVLEQADKTMDNGFIPQRASAVAGELRATSVSDMVQKVLAHLQPGQKIGRLTLSGHGAKGNISVGAGMGNIGGKIINGDATLWKPELAKLKDKFDETRGELFLRGCNVGAGQAGSKKLKELADFLNVKVYAPTGKVYDSSEEAGSVHQVAFPGSPAPIPKKTPSEEKAAKATAHTNPNSMLFRDLEEILFSTREEINWNEKPEQADISKTDSEWIGNFQTQLTPTDAADLKGLAAKANGLVFLKRGGQYQHLTIFNDFHHLIDKDFTLAYELSPHLREQVLTLFDPNSKLSYNSSQRAEDFGTNTTVDITVIDHNNDGYLGGSALFTLGELRAGSVKDMVDKVLNHLKEGQKIGKLTIIGHGNKGIIVMGSAKVLKTNKYINSNESEWKPQLQRLKGKFAETGEIFLRGCNTGAGTKGANKLKKIADIVGVKVSAPTGKVYPLSEESGSKHQVAYPNKPAPTPIPTPTESKKLKLSKAKSIDMTPTESIKAIMLHAAGLDDFPANPADYAVMENSPEFIQQFVNGIDFSQKEDASQLAAIIDAQLVVITPQGHKTYQLFNDFELIAVGNEWASAYSVSYDLKQAILQKLENRNDSTPSV
ncbi:DUF4347 domain-containing protein [Roseivirga sp. UBA838]|uniref:DUF4347 domain-containing protein n=1 Tax=Roseivirga sp. UBA838 TaxID=1947393 RepID=UPI00257F7857|nr:DUF4347 domain-containing protein [Roseivirga sp. UBA838]